MKDEIKLKTGRFKWWTVQTAGVVDTLVLFATWTLVAKYTAYSRAERVEFLGFMFLFLIAYRLYVIQKTVRDIHKAVAVPHANNIWSQQQGQQ